MQCRRRPFLGPLKLARLRLFGAGAAGAVLHSPPAILQGHHVEHLHVGIDLVIFIVTAEIDQEIDLGLRYLLNLEVVEGAAAPALAAQQLEILNEVFRGVDDNERSRAMGDVGKTQVIQQRLVVLAILVFDKGFEFLLRKLHAVLRQGRSARHRR